MSQNQEEIGCSGIKRKQPLALDRGQPLPKASGDGDLLETSKRIFRPKLYNALSSDLWSLQIKPAAMRGTNQKMASQRPSADRISNLPQATIEKILTLMPIRDALRTSILSRKWRYSWTRMPVLVIDDRLFKISSRGKNVKKYKLINAILHVLCLHKGPISEVRIFIDDWDLGDEVDFIILYLAKNNHIKKFTFKKRLARRYKIPSSFFSFHRLEHIDLTYCAIELPLVFIGLRMLRTVSFCNVEIATKTLQRFLTSCPLLEEFTLIGKPCEFWNGRIGLLPSVEHLATGGPPQKLPTLLVNQRLRILVFCVCFLEQYELSSVLCVIRTSPNLKKIKMKMCDDHNLYVQQTFMNLLDIRHYSDLRLDHLEELEITNFRNYAPEMAFVKLIMAKSPLLKKARLELNPDVTVDEELQMLRDLLQMSVPRASLAADFIIERPK